jgi:hypothetical protein
MRAGNAVRDGDDPGGVVGRVRHMEVSDADPGGPSAAVPLITRDERLSQLVGQDEELLLSFLRPLAGTRLQGIGDHDRVLGHEGEIGVRHQ